MIKSFADKETKQLFITGKSKRSPSELIKRAIRRLEYIHYASTLNDLMVPPSNRLHALKEDRKGQFQYRSIPNGESVSVSLKAIPTMLK